mgnify:CR=1
MYRREPKPKKARKKLKYRFKINKKPPFKSNPKLFQPTPDVFPPIQSKSTPYPNISNTIEPQYHPLVEEIKKAYLKE